MCVIGRRCIRFLAKMEFSLTKHSSLPIYFGRRSKIQVKNLSSNVSDITRRIKKNKKIKQTNQKYTLFYNIYEYKSFSHTWKRGNKSNNFHLNNFLRAEFQIRHSLFYIFCLFSLLIHFDILFSFFICCFYLLFNCFFSFIFPVFWLLLSFFVLFFIFMF